MTRTQKRTTNIQAVTGMMNYSQYGALAQVFIVEAIRRYATQVIENEAKLLEEMREHMISGEAWVGVAKEINGKLDQHLAK